MATGKQPLPNTMVAPDTGEVLTRGVRPFEVSYKGESVTVELPGYYPAGTGDGVDIGDDMAAVDEALRELKEKIEGLPSPATIRRVRTKLDLSQREAGLLLKVGENAFDKYERGLIEPSGPTSQLLRFWIAIPRWSTNCGEPALEGDDREDLYGGGRERGFQGRRSMGDRVWTNAIKKPRRRNLRKPPARHHRGLRGLHPRRPEAALPFGNSADGVQLLRGYFRRMAGGTLPLHAALPIRRAQPGWGWVRRAFRPDRLYRPRSFRHLLAAAQQPVASHISRSQPSNKHLS